MPRRFLLCAFITLLPTPGDHCFIAGVVTDNRGNELPQAVVQLENEVTLSVRSCIMGTDGRYRFAGVSGETDYTLQATYKKHWSTLHRVSRFDSSKRHHNVHLVIPIE